jgi:hypothetical protein
MGDNARPHRARIEQGYLQQEAIELLPFASHVTGYESDRIFMGLSRTKSERTYPKVSKHSRIRDCFGSGMATEPSTQTETEWGDVLGNCTGCEAVILVIDCVMSNKCSKLISFHFTTRLNVFWLYNFFFSRSQTETFFIKFFVQFCILTSASNSTSCYLFLKKYLICFGGLGYIVFIHKMFCCGECAQLQVLSHIWKTYFSYSEKLVVPNLWLSVYIYIYTSEN